MIWYKVITFSSLCSLYCGHTLPNFQYDQAEKESQYWNEFSKNKLDDVYKDKPILKKAKNIILFIADGMGISTITPSRILKGQLQNRSGEEAKLVFEDFPYISLIKTYTVDYQVPDSAGTATAFMCGVKTNNGVIGVNAKIKLDETDCELVKQNSLDSIMDWALDSGKSAGIVTSARVTHATPAGGYASVASRKWEGQIPSAASNGGKCKDIGRQLIEDEPGKRFSVIMGGGSRFLLPKNANDTITGKQGERPDGINLINKWLEMKKESGLKPEQYSFVDTRDKLLNVDTNKVDHLFGIFNDNHLSYDMERDPKREPSLAEMTEAAIAVLKKNDNGFFLQVEGARIDNSHHDNYAVMALYETIAFDKAIDKAVHSISLEDTLFVVTSDHSHTLTMNGNPIRGNNIKGIADNDSDTGMPYTTLMYGNGPGYEKNRTDPSKIDTSALRYRSHSAVLKLKVSNHGGEDVALYSIGPMAHMFRGTQEQSYVAHAMAFASCIGHYKNNDHEHCRSEHSSGLRLSHNLILILLVTIFKIILTNFK